jgi:hypothetical protein
MMFIGFEFIYKTKMKEIGLMFCKLNNVNKIVINVALYACFE